MMKAFAAAATEEDNAGLAFRPEPQGQWTGEGGPRSCPPPRSFHSCTVLKGSADMVVFGGVTGDSRHPTFLNDVWVRQDRSEPWSSDRVVYSGQNNVPEPRCRHSAVALHQGIYVFGGAPNADPNVYLLERLPNSTKLRWVLLRSLANGPEPRFGHAACELDGHSFMIFGGRSIADGTDFDDCFIFDARTLAWTKVTLQGSLPPKGSNFALFPIGTNGSEIVLIGTPRNIDNNDYDIFENTDHSGIIAFVLKRLTPGSFSCSKIRFEGFPCNSPMQWVTENAFRVRIGLVDFSVLVNEDEQNSSNRGSTNNLIDGSAGLPKLHLFPAIRWFPSFFKLGDSICCFGGIERTSGGRPSLEYAWRFRTSQLAERNFVVRWEPVRIDAAPHCRVGWSLSFDPRSNEYYIFGGTEVTDSYHDDVHQESTWKENGQEYAILRLPDSISRRFYEAPLFLGPATPNGPEYCQWSRIPYRGYVEDEITLQCRISFVTANVAVRFVDNAPVVQQLSPIIAIGNRRPNAINSLHSYKCFDNNAVWAVSWDLSLYLLSPASAKRESSMVPKPRPTSNNSDSAEGNSVSVLDGIWQRVIKPVVPLSPSMGMNLELLGSELTVVWPKEHREGFALERFTTSDAFYKCKNVPFLRHRPFYGDVLVMMGGLHTAKERSKVAKLLGYGEDEATARHAPNTSSESPYFNDIWMCYSTYSSSKYRFSPPSASLCSWKRLWPPSELSRTKRVERALFQGRARHTLTALPSMGVLVAFGGLTDGQKSPDAPLILIDLTMQSTEFTHANLSIPTTFGTPPSPRFNHAAAATSDLHAPRLVICGGNSVRDPSELLRDVHVWDFVTGVWTNVLVDLPIPSLGLLYPHGDRFYYFLADDYTEDTVDACFSFKLC